MDNSCTDLLKWTKLQSCASLLKVKFNFCYAANRPTFSLESKDSRSNILQILKQVHFRSSTVQNSLDSRGKFWGSSVYFWVPSKEHHVFLLLRGRSNNFSLGRKQNVRARENLLCLSSGRRGVYPLNPPFWTCPASRAISSVKKIWNPWYQKFALFSSHQLYRVKTSNIIIEEKTLLNTNNNSSSQLIDALVKC